MEKIKVAIVGIGNCASSLVQGLSYYTDSSKKTIGLMHPAIGVYKISDIEVVAAFDVNETKVGLDLSEAIFAYPNNAAIFTKVAITGILVQNAPVLDGLGKYLKNIIKPSTSDIPDAVKILKDSGAEILVNYLPVGSQKATEYWAKICLDAKIAFINCIPVFIASDKKWADEFTHRGIAVIGDDIKSQVGATIVHRTLTNLFLDRGMPIDRTYQLNIGGNTDFLNMLERERLTSKKTSKTRSIVSQIELRHQSIGEKNVHIGPSDYVPWLTDNKVAYIRIESRHFGDLPMNLEVRLSVEDSPDSAGIVVDAIRCAKLAIKSGIAGPLIGPSSYFMKSPPTQFTDDEAKEKVEEFIKEYA